MNKEKQTPRKVALQILQQVFDDKAYSNIALHQELERSQLSEQDKALVTELVYGSVARKIQLEWMLSHYIKDREKLDSWVYYLLLLSLYQFLYLDKIPTYAIVNQAVEIAKQKRGADKFVNAVLRKLCSEPLPDPMLIKRINKRLSIQYSTPVWLVKELIEEYGHQRAEAILKSQFVKNKVSLRVVHQEDYEAIRVSLDAKPSRLSPVGLVKEQGYIAGKDAFLSGSITIQDETSQLVAPTLRLTGEEFVLDACAAPGGKTTHIASYLTTGKVVALDLYEHKLSLIQENAKRLHLEEKVITQQLDATKVSECFQAETFDAILVDAPCSGMGLIRRKPDIKYTKDRADFASLQATQLQILDSVCQTVKKGGIITYSTCTIFSQENQKVLQEFLKRHPNFEQVPLKHECQDILQDGCLLITPELYMTDGFFISQVRRIS